MHTNLPSAPGPLYSVIHYALNPVTHLAPPAVRVPNLVFLLLTSFLVVLTLKKTGVAHPAPLGLALISLPIVWPCSGLALTEVPSLIMATAACFILTRVLTGTATSSRGVALLSALAGLCTSLAVLGRQTYLPLIALGLLPLSIRYGKKSLVPCVLYGGTASVLPGLVFVAWGGLVPPSQAHIKGFSPIHGITALAYLAACVLIVAPGYYRRLLRAQIIAAVAIAILNLCVLHFEWRALAGASHSIPGRWQVAYTLLIGSAVLAGAVMFLIATTANMLERRTEFPFLFFSLSAVTLACTAFAIGHLFSSRYVVNALPFVLLMTYPFYKPNLWAACRVVIGVALGAVSLWSYLC